MYLEEVRDWDKLRSDCRAWGSGDTKATSSAIIYRDQSYKSKTIYLSVVTKLVVPTVFTEISNI